MNFAPYFDKSADLPGVPIQGMRGYRSVPEATYRAFPALNQSLLKKPSACHMLHSLTEPDTIGHEASAVGTLTHWAVLEPHKILNLHAHAVECETKTLDSKAADRQRAENPDKLICTGEHLRLAADLRKAVLMHDRAQQLLREPGHNEVTGFHYEEGVWRKWRADRVQSDHRRILDVKTTRFPLCGPRAIGKWESECWERGYWIQAAWYLHHHQEATGIRPNAWTFIVVSKEPPLHCRLFTVRNYAPDHPLYAGSALQKARQLIGLEPGNDVPRMAVFLDSARQTIAAAERGQNLTPELLRAIWPAEENETEEPEIGLPYLNK